MDYGRMLVGGIIISVGAIANSTSTLAIDGVSMGISYLIMFIGLIIIAGEM